MCVFICLYHSILQMTRIFGLSIYIIRAQVECRKYWPTSLLSSTFIGIIAANKCAVRESVFLLSWNSLCYDFYPPPLLWKQPLLLCICPAISFFFLSVKHIAAFIISVTFFKARLFLLMRMTSIWLSTCSEVTFYKVDWAVISNIPLNIVTLSLQFKQSSVGTCRQMCVCVPNNQSKGHLVSTHGPLPTPVLTAGTNSSVTEQDMDGFSKEHDGIHTESRGSLIPFCLMRKLLEKFWPNILGGFGNVCLTKKTGTFYHRWYFDSRNLNEMKISGHEATDSSQEHLLPFCAPSNVMPTHYSRQHVGPCSGLKVCLVFYLHPGSGNRSPCSGLGAGWTERKFPKSSQWMKGRGISDGLRFLEQRWRISENSIKFFKNLRTLCCCNMFKAEYESWEIQ